MNEIQDIGILDKILLKKRDYILVSFANWQILFYILHPNGTVEVKPMSNTIQETRNFLSSSIASGTFVPDNVSKQWEKAQPVLLSEGWRPIRAANEYYYKSKSKSDNNEHDYCELMKIINKKVINKEIPPQIGKRFTEALYYLIEDSE